MYSKPNEYEPVVPKLASSVLIVRPKDESVEVFLIKRHETMKFLGGFHAFPGGRVEPADYSSEALSRFRGLSEEDACEQLRDRYCKVEPPEGLGFWTAAIREVFEETGLLYCSDENKKLFCCTTVEKQNKINQYRENLNSKKIKFHEILIKENLYFAVNQLKHFNHFTTPPISPIRYDTHFFFAILPQNQDFDPSSREIASSDWITPREALKKYRSREIKLIPPQIMCLKKLARKVKLDDIT